MCCIWIIVPSHKLHLCGHQWEEKHKRESVSWRSKISGPVLHMEEAGTDDEQPLLTRMNSKGFTCHWTEYFLSLSTKKDLLWEKVSCIFFFSDKWNGDLDKVKLMTKHSQVELLRKFSSPMGVKAMTFQNTGILEGQWFDTHWRTCFLSNSTWQHFFTYFIFYFPKIEYGNLPNRRVVRCSPNVHFKSSKPHVIYSM